MDRCSNINEGDDVIFVYDGSLMVSNYPRINDLTIGKFYKVLSVSMFDSTTDSIRVINDNGKEFGYFSIRFSRLSEYRKLKLDKLNIISNG